MSVPQLPQSEDASISEQIKAVHERLGVIERLQLAILDQLMQVNVETPEEEPKKPNYGGLG